MMNTINQPSAWPTRKLTGALVAAALMEIAGPKIIGLLALTLAPIGLTIGGPASVAVIQILVAGGVGYLIKDKPNV